MAIQSGEGGMGASGYIGAVHQIIGDVQSSNRFIGSTITNILDRRDKRKNDKSQRSLMAAQEAWTKADTRMKYAELQDMFRKQKWQKDFARAMMSGNRR